MSVGWNLGWVRLACLIGLLMIVVPQGHMMEFVGNNSDVITQKHFSGSQRSGGDEIERVL